MTEHLKSQQVIAPELSTGVLRQFQDAISSAGLTPPSQIIADGEIHRFSTNGESLDQAGWYVLFPDALPAGRFGNWRTGLNQTWCAIGSHPQTAEEIKASVARTEYTKYLRDEETERKQQEAKVAANLIWTGGPPASDTHPYLARKKVKSFGLREHRGSLLIPIWISGEVWSLQSIDSDGEKRFFPGGKISAGHYLIGDMLLVQSCPAVCIAEGYATAATIHEATGYPVAVAFNVGNLTAVSDRMRAQFPDVHIVVCADDDYATAGNPGLTKARDAVQSIGGRIAVPEFGDPRPKGATDFNDMASVYGLEAVGRLINAVVESPLPCVDTTAQSSRALLADWPDPKKIQAPLLPVYKFDGYALLPDALREWVACEAERMPCPPDFIATAVLVSLGAVIGARCAIKPKSLDNWIITPNLWGGIVASPSAKKSPAISAALKPLDRLIELAKREFAAEGREFDMAKTVFDAEFRAKEDAIKSAAKGKKDVKQLAQELAAYGDEKPKNPIQRRYKTNDTTVEKLGEILVDNPAGMLVLRDELVGLLVSFDREGREGDRAFYLEGWNGTSGFDTDRIGRGSISIPNLCISIFGGIQPDKLVKYLHQATKSLANDGLLQRFNMLVFPDDRSWEWRDILPNSIERDRVTALFEAIANFDPVAWGAAPPDGSERFPCFRFDDDAQRIFIGFSANLHQQIASEEHPIIAQHLTKYDKLFPALALIFHLVECASNSVRGPVTIRSATLAEAWCKYLETHARRCYGLVIDDGLRAAIALAKKLESGELSDGFTVHDVHRKGWSGLISNDEASAAVEWLTEESWLECVASGGTGPGSGRKTRRFLINPKLRLRDTLG